ncbi:hypothetical protein O181_028393 [Austropuccinia psidii MF-1]|uniref:Uncharacterized protein n=1 Tax=Austropuccinia psidii MF-1 TaxID=1389203 RepID=A0A9Q3H1S5_9BASI|nr:hypothetical protein [Austropuccinia psidii MF-1]
MELCNATQIEEWKIDNTSNVRRLKELPQGNSRNKEYQVPIRQKPEINLKHSKAEVTSNELKISTKNNVSPNYPQTSENTYISNMEASTLVGLVQKEGFQPKQLFNSVSPVCGIFSFILRKKQNPVSEFYKQYVEAIFSKPKHSILPMDLLIVVYGSPIKFTQNLFNKFKNKKMQEKLKKDSTVENKNENNEQINADFSYTNSIQEGTHQIEDPPINSSLEYHTLNKNNFNLTKDEASSHEEQKIKIKYKSCTNENYFSIQEDKIEGTYEHKELNNNNKDIAQL